MLNEVHRMSILMVAYKLRTHSGGVLLKNIYKQYISFYNFLIYIPVSGGGPEPIYSDSVSPLVISLPGIFPTNQWCHSLYVCSLRLGASGSITKILDYKLIVFFFFSFGTYYILLSKFIILLKT